ncbi:helix-turn-helix domain-containing protein [Streptomyces sp. bgisy084]|uniref:AraC-like ligand-binding domain-containing protein n=1 Tax=Streptomyces sp. bgisy084 TaxID=3413777 RepID=UPI003D720278
MLPETLFRSEDVPAAERFECFSELMGRTHAPLQLLSDHREDFRASQRLLTLGDVSVWPTTFQPVCFRRTPKLIRQSDPEGVHISLPLRGTLRVTSREHEAAYDPSHLCVLDTSQPVDVRGGDLSRPHTGVGVEVPKALLSVPPNEISKLTTLQLSAKEGYGALIAKLLTQLAADSSSYKPTDGPRLGLIMTDLLSALFSQALDADNSLTPETRRRSLVLRIQAFIQQHLHDPQLTPTAIATAHHISTTYRHRLFQQEDTTVAAWIRRKRLEYARRDLADPAQHTTPIHPIATRWGFPRAADFTRAFRTTYGTPPKDYRHHTLHTPNTRRTDPPPSNHRFSTDASR